MKRAWCAFLLLCVAASLRTSYAATDPTVTVMAVSGGVASEQGPTPGVFQFTRVGDVTQPLSVNFTLGGTATRDIDYLIWETNALFAVGASNTFVTVLPRNDALAEGTETVRLTLNAGVGYSVGGSSVAMVQIADWFTQGLPGVGDNTITDGNGLPLIAPDLTYFDAWITNGALNIVVGLLNANSLVNNLEIFLNTDQRMDTGDWRAGHVAGQEFRVHATTGFLAGYDLYRLPTTAPVNPQQIEQDIFATSGGGSAINGGVAYSIPLTQIGNPAAVDVFVATHIGAGSVQYQGIGDRLPKFGALDTTSRKVVVRRPARTQIASLSDVAGDVNRAGFDLLSAEINVVADQCIVALRYAQFFNPENTTLFPGPKGEVLIDSDRSVLTGGFPIGVAIPTWGADCVLEYDLSAPVPVFLLVPFSTGQSVTFGQDRNDGRWRSSNGRDLVFTVSVSLLDPLLVGSGLATPARVPINGRVVMQTATFNELGGLNPNGFADRIPGGARVLDSDSGLVLEPFVWDATKTITAMDPLDYPLPPISGQDLVQVDAEIVEGHLVVKGTLSAWSDTDVGNLFEIALDTDLNPVTAPLGTLRNGAAGDLIGVDYRLQVFSLDVGTARAAYGGLLVLPNGNTLRVDATVLAQPNFQSGQPGSFTVTIPLSALNGVGPQLQFYVTAGRLDLGPNLVDIAPPAPVVMNITTGTAPTIITQPQSRAVTVGESVSFSVTATGAAPLAYQWRRNGIGLSVQTNATLTLSNVRTTDAGNYTVIVSNLAGSVPSQEAALTVYPPPRLTSISRRPSGGFELTLGSQPGRSLELQTSTNLASWLSLTTLANTNGTLTYIDVSPSGASSRFYRARLRDQ